MREALARAAVAQWLAKTAKAGLDQAKAEIIGELLPGDRMHAQIDGKDVATVSVTDPKVREVVTVTDPKAFAEWVQEYYPDAIVPTVADWFCAEGNLKAVIAGKGEVPPGVDIVEKVGSPTVQVRLSIAQEANLSALAAHTPVTRYITQAGEE